MKLVIKGWTFEGNPSEVVSNELVEVVESFVSGVKDGRALPLMAALRHGAGAKLGQIPELLDRFKIPYEAS